MENIFLVRLICFRNDTFFKVYISKNMSHFTLFYLDSLAAWRAGSDHPFDGTSYNKLFNDINFMMLSKDLHCFLYFFVIHIL